MNFALKLTHLSVIASITLSNFSNAQVATTTRMLQGNWMLVKGRIFHNYAFQAHLVNTPQYLSFGPDSLVIRPGIFYGIMDTDREDYYPESLERFPFTYYGYSTHYQGYRNSIKILDPPYKKWIAFHVKRIDSLTVQLINRRDTVVLKKCRNDLFKNPFSDEIEFINAKILKELYGVFYEVTLYPGDSLYFRQPKLMTTQNMEASVKLRKGYFRHVVESFALVDLRKLPKREYRPHTSIDLTIRFKNGNQIETQLDDDHYLRELEIAIIPLIYGHLKHIYKDPPIKRKE